MSSSSSHDQQSQYPTVRRKPALKMCGASSVPSPSRPAPPPPPPRIDSVIQQIRRNVNLSLDTHQQQAQQQQYNHQFHPRVFEHHQQTPPAPELPVKLRPKNVGNGSTTYLSEEEAYPPPPPAVFARHHPSFDLSSSSSCHHSGGLTAEEWRDSKCSSWSGKHYSFSCPQHLCQHQYSTPTVSQPPDQHQQPDRHQQHQHAFVPTPTSLITSFNGYNLNDPGKPPLPPKKKSVMEYMQMVGSYVGPNDSALSMYRHSMHVHHSVQQLHQQQQQQQQHPQQLPGSRKSPGQHMHLSSQTLRQVDKSFHVQHSLDSCLSVSSDSSLSTVSRSSSGCESMISRSSIPQPGQTQQQQQHRQQPPPLPSKSNQITSAPSAATSHETCAFTDASCPPPLPPKTFRKKENIEPAPRSDAVTLSANQTIAPPAVLIAEVPQRKKSSTNTRIVEETKHLLSSLAKRGPDPCEDENRLLHELDVSQYLIFKSTTDDGPEIRGGTPDALLVKAAEVNKNEFLFQEAFLATYRTFVTPKEVIDKLLLRYNKFITGPEATHKIARNAFVLLVRVVDDLCLADCTDELMNCLLTFVCQLVQRGDHALAKVLRNKTTEKMEARKAAQEISRVHLPSMAISTKVSSLLDFKSLDLAEQMTIIDSQLFAKIEVAEALVWAREQREEVIPNLTKFTEHFNNMSYWVRTRILQAEEQKERERICMKFIKVMRNLKKVANFNSIFAILSALDSAPIRRLDWPRSNTEGMKEFASLIDSSSSFRAYRQVLADTLPPCIPYIGLILQDLTFVHVGNDDFLPDGNINFCKRWLQFNILDQMRRFRNSHYPLLKKNEEIVSFFSNFEDYLHEESLWQISESIKPRGKK